MFALQSNTNANSIQRRQVSATSIDTNYTALTSFLCPRETSRALQLRLVQLVLIQNGFTTISSGSYLLELECNPKKGEKHPFKNFSKTTSKH